jgi:lipoprotein signal peptidase
MVETMANNQERNRVKMTILSFILSGAIKNAQDSSVMNDFAEISRTI